MGETLRIAHNVFEKMEREKDRKERLKKVEDWQREKREKKKRLDEMRAKLRDAQKNKSVNGSGMVDMAAEEDIEFLEINNEDDFEFDGGSLEGGDEAAAAADEAEAEETVTTRSSVAEAAPEADVEAPSVAEAASKDAGAKCAETDEGKRKATKCGKCVIQ